MEVKQLTEEWETKLEERKRKHNLEVKQLEEEVERGQEYQEQLREEARLEFEERCRERDEMRKERDEEREGKWKKGYEIMEHRNREGTTKRAKGKKDNGE